MYARILALVGLLSVGAFAESLDPGGGNRRIFVLVQDLSGMPPSITSAMREEAAAQIKTTGYDLHWLDRPREVTAALLVIVTLSERTTAKSKPWPPDTVLASAAVADGRILPFVRVNCSALRDFLAPALHPNDPDASELYGRALGRLLSHELYHIAGQTGTHTATGITQSAVSIEDLLGRRLALAQEAIARLRKSFDNR